MLDKLGARETQVSRLLLKTRSPLPSLNRKIFRAAALVTFAGILVKIAATVKELVVASQFGRSDSMDAFLIAFLIPGLLVNLFSESMNQALIPTLVQVREDLGKRSAQKLLSTAMLATCTLSLAGSIAMAASARLFFPLIAARFAPTKLDLAEHIFYCLLPLVLLSGIASNCTAVLNTTERFALPALAPIVTPLIIGLSAWWFAGRFGIWVLVYASLIGAGAHASLTIWMIHLRGYSFHLEWHVREQHLRPAILAVVGQYGPVLLSGLVSSAGLLVDQGMAAMLPAGSVSTLVYANRLVGVILTLLAGALATVLTPYLSEMVARRDWTTCLHTLTTYTAVTTLISVPLAFAMIFGSNALVRLTFQHGVFTAKDTELVAPVQAMYAIQIPFFVVSRVFYRYLVAIRRTSVIFYCGIINLVLDVALNLVLMRWLGVAGIALATSIWTISTFLFLGYWTYRLLPGATLAKWLKPVDP